MYCENLIWGSPNPILHIPQHTSLHLTLSIPAKTPTLKQEPNKLKVFILHNVPVQLHLLRLLHQSKDPPFEVGLETDVILKDQRLVHLHVNHLRGQTVCEEMVKN